MGQKVNPVSLRLQLNRDWNSKWFAHGKEYQDKLAEDIKVRKLLEQQLDRRAGIERIEIERSTNQVTVTVYSAKPGVVIGRGGAGVEAVKKELEKLIDGPVRFNIEEVKKPELKAKLIAENVASQLERRFSFRRAIKATADATMRAGAKGVKVTVSGRLNGAEMARTETEALGSIPLHTLRANIDFAQTVARTTYGVIGVKVWVYKEEGQ